MHRGLQVMVFAGAMALLPHVAMADVDPGPAQATPGQDYLVKIWGADEGMPVTSVTDVAQTSEGYLWIGTLLGGLLRFDGVRFVAFNSANTPEILSAGVRRLAVDQNGRLWINTYNNALVVWDHAGFQKAAPGNVRMERLLWSSAEELVFLDAGGNLLWLQRKDSRWRADTVILPGLKGTQIGADSSGKVWCLSTNDVVAQWQPGRTLTLSPPPGLEGEQVRVLVADRLGRVWAGTDRMLARLQGDRFVPIVPAGESERLAVKRIIPAGTGSVWVEANGRMRRLANDRWVAESPAWVRDLGQVAFLRFAAGDSKGGFWCGFRDYGLIHVAADGTLVRLATRDGLPSDSLRFVCEDREGNVWTGYERGGLVQIRRRLFRILARQQGVTDTLVSTVCQDTEGAIWIGAHAGTVTRCQDGQCTNINLSGGWAGQPTVVTADAAGRTWFSISGVGLMVRESGQVRLAVAERELPGGIRLLAPARDSELWIGNLRGLWSYKDHELVPRLACPNPGGAETPAALIEAADGVIWAGTFGGFLLRWDGTRFQRSEPPDRATLGRLWALCAAKDGDLWIGSSGGGLLHWTGGRFLRYTTRQGLPSDCIVQVMLDEQGNLWLGTGVGIVRVDEAALSRFDRGELATLPVSIYGREDGLLTSGPALEFQPNCWRGEDGMLWFATANGVAGVRSDSVHINPLPPSVVAEEVQMNHKPLWPRRPGAVFASSALKIGGEGPVPPLVRVGPGRKDLDFSYTGLSLGSPLKVRFKYLLQGLDRNWTDAGGERTATYRSVPPGQYRFRVMACNSDGQWGDPSTLARIEVAPRFYETVWFRGGAILAALGGVSAAAFLLARGRARRRIAELKRQGEIERERTRIAQDLHDDLGSALSEISFLGTMGRPESMDASEIRSRFDSILERARSMAQSLDEIVWAVNPGNDTLASTASYLCSRAQERSHAAGVHCRLDVAAELPARVLPSEARHNVLMAVTEAITNVMKHSRATEVWLRIQVRGDTLVISVEDNGCGFDAAHEAGARNGLSNMRRRCERLGGGFEIQSSPGQGAKVTFLLPLGMPAVGK